MTGTGYWRYSLEKNHKPKVNTFKAAFLGHTTTLRPVTIAPAGVDIDAIRCVLGDKTSRLAMDLSEVTQKQRPWVTLEIIHQKNKLDIESSGCVLAIHSLEHDVSRNETYLLQHDLDLSTLEVYDLTGGYNTVQGKGPRWEMTGPLLMPTTQLYLEKTLTLNTKGFDLNTKSIKIGNSSGIAELIVGSGNIKTGKITIGSKDTPGHLHLGSANLHCTSIKAVAGSSIYGEKVCVIEVTESIDIAEGVILRLNDVELKAQAKDLINR